ncbi:hypothetical protein, partial [Oryzihumus sp.]
VHNWWHHCLYRLELGDMEGPLRVYDAVLHHAGSDGLVLEMLDASALLWRMYLEGEDLTPRWQALAAAWEPKTAQPHYAFNDMHAVMAFVGAGWLADARRLVDERARWAAQTHPAADVNVTMTRDVGLPVGAALLAFGEGRYDDAVELLLPIRGQVHRFGGSHAQRDAVQRTLVESALRSGRLSLARALLSERLGVRPCSPYNWLKHAELAEAMGDAAAAAADRARALELRAG